MIDLLRYFLDIACQVEAVHDVGLARHFAILLLGHELADLFFACQMRLLLRSANLTKWISISGSDCISLSSAKK